MRKGRFSGNNLLSRGWQMLRTLTSQIDGGLSEVENVFFCFLLLEDAAAAKKKKLLVCHHKGQTAPSDFYSYIFYTMSSVGVSRY